MNEKDSKWTYEDWIEAYEDEMRRVLKYTGFSCTPKSAKVFSTLASRYPEVNPYLFMAANSPERREWWIKKNDKWVKQKFPFPNQLYGKKCIENYKLFLERGIKIAKPRQEAILEAVKSSQQVLRKCRITENDFQEIWDMYSTDYISPYYVVLIKPMRKWLNIQMRKGEISLNEKKVLDDAEKVIDGYPRLSNKLFEIMKGK